MSNESIFELVEETKEHVIVKVNAKDPLTVARHPYVDGLMAYVNVTRGTENTYTVVNEDGSTWSWRGGKYSVTSLPENTRRLGKELRDFIASQGVFLDVITVLNPYAAKFYLYKGAWWVDFLFADAKGKGRKYFADASLSAGELVEREFTKFNELFAGQGEHVVAEGPSGCVDMVYRVEINDCE